MKIYTDTSAFLKLLLVEPESEGLKAYLRSSSPRRLVSSMLLETESRRAARRAGVPQRDVTLALTGVSLADAPRSLFTEAGLLEGATLRSLDAIHVATALRHGVDLLIAYDHRLLDVATTHGIPTASPV